ncbi:hypothetical protein BSKO_01329 [Bryopsis sp. KO-2023]|nr:hypothetical protein BSKO_01329 [Bryopsis sp. KO-2023]
MPKATPGGALLTGFSEDGERFVIVAPDGRTRVFDTSNGRCSINLAAGSNFGSGKSNSGEFASAYCWGWLEKGRPGVFLGGTAGSMKALDVIDGDIKWTSEEEGEILSLSWNKERLFSSTSAGCIINKLQSSDGVSLGKFKAGNHAPAQIKGIPGFSRVLVGSSTLALWDVDTEEVLAKYAGHATPITAISLSPNGKFGMSTAEGERHIAVWNIHNYKKKKNKAACTLSMDAPVKHMDTQYLPGKSGMEKKDFMVVAVSTTGMVHVWRCTPKKLNKMEVVLWATVGLGEKGDKRHDGVISAKLERGADVPALLLARGNTGKPVFERILLPDLDENPATLTLDPIQGGLLMADTAVQEKKQKKRKREVVLGPDNEGEEVLMRGMGLSSVSKRPAMENGSVDDGQTPEIAEGRSSGEEATLGDRLMALEQRMQETKALPPDQDVALSSTSIMVLVNQAVQSADFALLDVILTQGAVRMAPPTIKKMSHEDAASLLSMLIERFQATFEVESLLGWIRPVLENHAGYLMSAPTMRRQLSSLYQSIESRLGKFSSMLSLAGRTRLLVAQMQMRERKRSKVASIPEGPEVVFQIGDADVEENDGDVEGEDVGLDGVQIEGAGDEERMNGVESPPPSGSESD